jgi:hypothetical protein
MGKLALASRVYSQKAVLWPVQDSSQEQLDLRPWHGLVNHAAPKYIIATSTNNLATARVYHLLPARGSACQVRVETPNRFPHVIWKTRVAGWQLKVGSVLASLPRVTIRAARRVFRCKIHTGGILTRARMVRVGCDRSTGVPPPHWHGEFAKRTLPWRRRA